MSKTNENKEPVAVGSDSNEGLDRKALEIMEALARMCEKGESITIANDWGYGSGTLIAKDGSHTHFGGDWGEDEAEQFARFVDGLHAMLVHSVGLSWCPPQTPPAV